MDVPLDEQCFFDAITSDPDTGGAADADAAPTFDVFEETSDTAILDDQTMTKRTGLTGNYRGSFIANAANGFEVGKWYSVIASATINGVTGKAVLKNFRVVQAESVAGSPRVDVSHWAGSATAIGNAALATAPSNFASLLINASGHVSRVTLTDTLTTYTSNTPQTGDAFARLGAPTLASHAADVAAVKADTAAVLDDTGTSGVVVASASKTGYSLAAAGLDSIVIETGMNARQALSVCSSALVGVLAGADTVAVTIAAAGVPATNRVTATVDASGNRSVVTLSLPS